MRLRGIVALLGCVLLLAACGGDQGEPAPDGPQIDRTSPADGDSDIDPDVAIQVWFAEPIDRNRLSDDHLHLLRADSNLYGKISYDLGQNILSLNMTAPLSGGEYQAVLKAGVCDLDGQCLKEELCWSFTVSE
jgi:hypothetical protein